MKLPDLTQEQIDAYIELMKDPEFQAKLKDITNVKTIPLTVGTTPTCGCKCSCCQRY